MFVNKIYSYIHWGITVLFIVTLWAYWATPVTGDILVFLGSSHLADIQYGGGIWGAIQSWELKPLGNRIFIYFIYKTTLLFIDFADKDTFIAVCKIIYLFFILGAGYLLADLYRCYTKEYNNKKFIFFVLFFSSVLLLHSFRIILQAEYTSLLLSVYAIRLLLGANRYVYLSGVFLMSVVFFFKGVTIVFCGQALLILYVFYGWHFKQVLKTFMDICLVIVAIGALVYYIYPQEYADFFNAIQFQGKADIITPIQYIKWIIWACIRAGGAGIHLVFLIPSLFIFVIYSCQNLSDKEKLFKRIIPLSLIWGSGFFMIGIQHQFFVYHYVVLGLPLLFSLYLYPELKSKYKAINRLLYTLTLAYLILFFCITTPFQEKCGSYCLLKDWSYTAMKSQFSDYKRIRYFVDGLNPDPSSSVLYLDAGGLTWCLGYKSISRYYFPLPIARLKCNGKLLTNASFNELVHTMNEFDGKYIMMDTNWFEYKNIAELTPFIKNLCNYEKLSVPGVSYICIYKRLSVDE